MKYPVLSNTKCSELAEQLVSGVATSIPPHVLWMGFGEELDLTPIAKVAEEITLEAQEWTDSDRDRFEGKASTQFLASMSHVPPEVLDDRGFWRYVSLRYFWGFIAWREERPFAEGNYLRYVNAATSTESVLPRMYLRARAVGGPDHAELAGAIPRGTDFWRSHVVRVRTGSASPIARAFAQRQAEDRLSTAELRQAARHLNRVWTNIVLHLYDDDAARSVIDPIWEAQQQ